MNLEHTNLAILSDHDLNNLIGELLNIPVEERTTQSEMLGFASAAEWRTRYPGTIPPVTFERAQKEGGFPSCYTGPRETIDLSRDGAG